MKLILTGIPGNENSRHSLNSTGAESTGANSTGADLTGAQQCSLHSDTDVALNWYCSSAETNSHKSRSSRGYKDCLFGGS